MFFRCSATICLAVLLETIFAQDCRHDFTQLLQVAPEDKLDKASPSHRHGSDFSEIMDAAKGAIGKVTSMMTHAFEVIDQNLVQEEKAFKLSLAHYNARIDGANSTVQQNLTAFQALIDERTKDLEPFYANAADEVMKSFSAAKTAMALMGQKNLLDKLDQLQNQVSTEMKNLARTTTQMNYDMASATEGKLRDYIVTMIQKLDNMASIADQLSSDVNDGLRELGGGLLEPLKLAVGDSAAADITSLSRQAAQTLKHLQTYLNFMKTNFVRLSTGINPEEYEREQGFFGTLFKGLLGPGR